MNALLSKLSVCAFLLAFLSLAPPAATKVKLGVAYRELVSGPPSLLLTKDEKTAFGRLQNDGERDSFIQHFWEVRNPTPGLDQNEFKEEFYRRVAYADAYYGRDAGSVGWRTDRGRAYILFGKPQTSMSYQGNQELYGTELWFYSNPGLSELPAFFYVIFFEGDGVSGYHIYHPYTDGPEKLMRQGGTSKGQAYRYLHGISAELAQASLSYIPGEPADTVTFTGSMQSMQVVNAIQSFNEMPSYVASIRAHTERLERVTTKIEYKLAQSDLLTFVAIENGKPWVHWRMEVNDGRQQKWVDERARLEVRSRLYSKGRLVLEQSDRPEFAVPASSAEQIGGRPLVYEDKIPVAVGRYQLAVELKNSETGGMYEAAQEFEVKAPSGGVVISDVLVISKHQLQPQPKPFRFGGVEFFPSALNYASASRGLSVLYQIALPKERPAELIAHYSIGGVASGTRKVLDEKLDLKGVDPSGTLFIGKTLAIEELSPGLYRLSVRIEDPASKKTAASALSFKIPNQLQEKVPIVIARDENDSVQNQAAVHYERALCLLAQDRPSEAAESLKASWALSRNAAVKSLLDHLSAPSTGGKQF